MLDGLLILNSILLLVALAALVLLIRRPADRSSADAVTRLQADLLRDLTNLRAEAAQTASNQRSELAQQFNAHGTSINQTLTTNNQNTGDRLAELSTRFKHITDSSTADSSKLRSELELKLNGHAAKLTEINSAITNHLDKLRTAVENRLTIIQQSNDLKLEQMRATVDEKLQSTLEKRLGESFKQVADRLDGVQKGFGEMQALAGNVTDLRRIMTNVKTRGTWGEVQLANLLEQLFAAGQYVANFKPKRTGEVVEFALRLPGGASGGSDEPVYLPIDSKFPVEDFQRLAAAAEAGDPVAVAAARKALENRIYACAADIKNKYINVPVTTDFAVLFLPTESLHAEVLRIDGLCECLQRDYRVTVTGPTTFAAFATALLVGFQTLKIQKSTAAVAKLLGAVKTDFAKFADLLESVENKLDSAKKTVGDARHRSDMIVTKLDRVDGLPLSPDAPTALIEASPTHPPTVDLAPPAHTP